MDLELSPDDNDLIIDSDCNQDELDFGLLDEKDDEDTEKNVAVHKPSILSDLVRQPDAPAKRPSLQPLQARAGAGGLPQVSQEVTRVSVDMSGQVRPPSLSALPGGWRPPPGRVRGSAGQQSDLQAHQQGGGHQDLSHSDHPTSSIIR